MYILQGKEVNNLVIAGKLVEEYEQLLVLGCSGVVWRMD